MATVAVYNAKGGVGKTTIACSLAAEAARRGYRVLLWEIDAQGDSSWLLGGPALVRPDLSRVVSGIGEADTFIQPTTIDGLSMLPSDTDMRNLDNLFTALARNRKLQPLLDRLEERFDLIFFDCPPGAHSANLQIIQHAHLLLMPCVPAPLALNSLERVRELARRLRGPSAPVLPVFSMADRRRRIHKETLAQHPDWPVVPYSSEIERMSAIRAPVGIFAPQSDAAGSLERLWLGTEGWLRSENLLRHPQANADQPPLPPRYSAPRERRSGAFGSVRRIFARQAQPAG